MQHPLAAPMLRAAPGCAAAAPSQPLPSRRRPRRAIAGPGHVVPAPMVGTFYAAASPGAKPFVEIGDEVKPGEVLCIIEAMKMMNQIESDKAGRSRRSWPRTATRSNSASRCSSSSSVTQCSTRSSSPIAARSRCASCAPAANSASRPSPCTPRPTTTSSTCCWPTRRCASARRRRRDSYLNMPAIISAAEVTDSVAIHPGYGFLSENADFAERVEKSGFMFIGPRAGDHPADGRQGLGHQVMMKAGACPACRARTARWATDADDELSASRATSATR